MIAELNKTQLMLLYERVFDNQGNIKLCGREACKELIRVCREMQHGIDFGCTDTGIMNVDNIKRFYMKIIN